MNLRKKFERDIRKKESEIQELKERQRELDLEMAKAEASLETLCDALKHIPSDTEDENDTASLRPGSKVGKAVAVLRDNAAPLHVNEILKKMGIAVNKSERAALSGQLSSYVRQGRILTRTAPNTFGLLEWKQSAPPDEGEPDIPDSFGQVA